MQDKPTNSIYCRLILLGRRINTRQGVTGGSNGVHGGDIAERRRKETERGAKIVRTPRSAKIIGCGGRRAARIPRQGAVGPPEQIELADQLRALRSVSDGVSPNLRL